MRGANGSADPSTGRLAKPEHLPMNAALGNTIAMQRFSPDKINGLVSALEMPFEPSVIEWRVTNTAKGELRGQVVPYADPRAYTDRLNTLFTPAGWTRRYAVHTSANFERAKDNKIVAKVVVTCELTIFGLGSHSATGEGWAEPKSIPRVFGWATPQGWRQGLRPRQGEDDTSSNSGVSRTGLEASVADGAGADSEALTAMVAQIEAMAKVLGRRLYRGILKTVARVWSPTEIRDADVLRKVLEQMKSAERGLRRWDVALNRVGPETLVPVLRSLRLDSLAQVDSLETLKKVVLAAEQAAGITH